MTVRPAARSIVVAVGLVALAPLSWRLVAALDDMTSHVSASDRPDYMVRPLRLSGEATGGIALVSATTVIIATSLLVTAVRRGTIPRQWYGIVAPIAAIAVYAGVTYAEMTAAVIGANIGAGLFLLGAAPFAAGMLALEVSWLVRLRRRRPTDLGPPPTAGVRASDSDSQSPCST
jgi:hypothetical protein